MSFTLIMAAFYLYCRQGHQSTIHVNILAYDGCLRLYLLAIA